MASNRRHELSTAASYLCAEIHGFETQVFHDIPQFPPDNETGSPPRPSTSWPAASSATCHDSSPTQKQKTQNLPNWIVEHKLGRRGLFKQWWAEHKHRTSLSVLWWRHNWWYYTAAVQGKFETRLTRTNVKIVWPMAPFSTIRRYAQNTHI